MFLLEIFLAPIIGASIGYFTNLIAIKMFFKPHKKLRIAKITIPFTPGIIPKYRKEISKNIAIMISKTLLNENTIKNQLNSEYINNIFYHFLNNKINNFIIKDYPSLKRIIPKEIEPIFNDFFNKIKNKFFNFIKNWIYDPNFNKIINKFFNNFTDKFLNKSLKNILSDFSDESIENFLIKIFTSLSKKNILDELFDKLWNNIITNKKNLKNYIPDSVLNLLLKEIKTELPNFIDQLEKNVFESNMNEEIYMYLVNAIYDYLNNLNSIQQLVINAWGIKERIKKDLPPIINQVLMKIFINLKSKNKQIELLNYIDKSIDNILFKPIETILEKNNSKQDIKNNFKSKFKNFLNESNFKKLSEYLFPIIKDFKLKDYLKINEVNDGISNYFISIIRNESNLESLFLKMSKHLDDFLLHRPIGHINKIITVNEIYKKKISNYLSTNILKFFSKESNKIVKAMDLENIIRNKIDQFPIKQIEEMILLIIKKHLKWINIFGAILGTLIASIQYFL